MIRRVVPMRAFFAVIVAAATPLAAQTAGGAKHPGVEFEMKATISASGAMSGMMSAMGPGYSAHGVAAGTRMRIDIVDGAFPPIAGKGDYVLFDTSGITVVHPATKEFVPIPKDFASKTLDQMQARGMSITIGDIAVTFDSLPGIDTIAGFPTRHFKLTAGYTLTMDGMGTSQQMKSSGTTEYWMATIPGLASSPLQQTGQMGGGNQALGSASSGPFKEIAVRSDSLIRRMTGTAVRTRTMTNSDTGMGAMGLEIASEMTSVRQASIADSMFVVPSDYTRGASPFPGGH